MKSNLMLVGFFLVLYTYSLKAQITNAGFEDWDVNGNPVNWQANNNPVLYTTIKKTTDRNSGNWALEGDVVPFSVLTVGPSIYSGVGAVGFPINFRPVAIKGYYKFTSVSGDYLQVQANFRKNGVYIGGAAGYLDAASSYTQFSLNSNFITGDVPDTVLIAIFVSHSTGFPHVGSKMFIDDLSWGTATDVNENNAITPNEYKLEQNYPNPFNPSTRIQYQVSSSLHVSLNVYDVLGNEVAKLVNEYKPAGKYEVDFEAAGLISGIYFYRLQTNSFVETKKMILLH